MADEPRVLNIEQTLDLGLWEDFPGTIDYLVEKCAQPAEDLRETVADLYVKSDISVYWNPALEKAGLYVRPELDQEEFDWYLSAISEKVGNDHVVTSPLTPNDLQDWWVKVAYSPTLRRTGELLQFFPSDDIPGFGGRPIASTIASGLLGAGLGFGGGYLLDKLTPAALRGKRGRLKYLGALMGGLAGAGVGATPGVVNWMDGRSFNDPTLWSGRPEDGFDSNLPSNRYQKAIAGMADREQKRKDALEKEGYQIHPPGISSTMGGPSFEQAPLIRTNELGQVLWGTRADPQTTAMTMGAVYGANQMPDPRSRPGYVTPHQTGLFGMAMGAAGGGLKGYATGFLVGKGLGVLTGMPQGTQDKIKQTGAALGAIRSLVPKLFN